MKRVSVVVFLVGATSGTGCVQKIDSSLTSGNVTTVAAASSDPVSEGVSQCEAGSAACYNLCGSPLCALKGGTIPPALGMPPIYNANGSTAASACDQIRQESIAIRQRSCTPCHLPMYTGLVNGFNYVMDDHKLVTNSSRVFTNDAGGLPYAVPGDPEGSFMYQRTMYGLGGSSQGMPPPADQCKALIGAQAAAGIVRPSAEDVSVLYEWITNCIEGTDGGAYAVSYYGAFYGPGADGGDTGVMAARSSTDAGGTADGEGGRESGTTPIVSTVQKDASVEAAVGGDSGAAEGGIIAHPNLITNGAFSQGTSSWGVAFGTGTLSNPPGQLCVAFGASQTVIIGWPSPSATPGASLSATASYTFSFSARSTRANVTLDVKVGDSRGPAYAPVDFESATDALSTTSQTFTHLFSPANGADPSAGVSFSLTSAVAQTVCLQNVLLAQN